MTLEEGLIREVSRIYRQQNLEYTFEMISPKKVEQKEQLQSRKQGFFSDQKSSTSSDVEEICKIRWCVHRG